MSPQATHPLSRAAPTISDADYGNFCAFFYARTGIMFGAQKRYFVDKRLIERMQATGARCLDEYLSRLRRHGVEGEIGALINLMTINETYFYREEHQLDCLVHGILPELVAGRGKGDRIRIWSLPCSTGEEPYSIAIHLLENWPLVDDYDVEIIASDIDSDVLRAAEAGRYETRSLHRLPPAVVKRYFTTVGPASFQLIGAIRQSVRFTQVNASDEEAMRKHGGMDVVLCRNMLIYFDDLSRRKVVESIYGCLRPGGFLCLGHSESMSRISSLFTVRKFPQAIVYQKDGGVR